MAEALYLGEYGTRLVWAADEFYLNAGQVRASVRSLRGLSRSSKTAWGWCGGSWTAPGGPTAYPAQDLPRSVGVSVTTGTLSSSILTRWAQSLPCENLQISVFPITNRLFGDTVTVAGLIAGRDIIDQLRGRDLGEALFVPSVSVRDGMFLDNVTLDKVERELGARVIVVHPRPYQLIRAILRDVLRGSAAGKKGSGDDPNPSDVRISGR